MNTKLQATISLDLNGEFDGALDAINATLTELINEAINNNRLSNVCLSNVDTLIDTVAMGNKINLSWHIDDVIETAKEDDIDLTDDQARDILAFLKKNHDASLGVCWETIQAAIEYCLDK